VDWFVGGDFRDDLVRIPLGWLSCLLGQAGLFLGIAIFRTLRSKS
jgi:hypothetical protein